MDMFHSDWLSIAMGNGCQALKEKADYVTDTNVNDGIKRLVNTLDGFNKINQRVNRNFT